MAEDTIKLYEEMKTEKLKTLLKSLETSLYNTDFIMNEIEQDSELIKQLDNKIKDYEIDISLIRMELNKRLWFENEK